MISLIGDEKLAASEAAGKRKIPWKQMTAVAACAVVLLSSAFVYAKLRTSTPEKPDNPVIEMPSDSPAELRILSTSATTYYSSSLIANDTGFMIQTENGSKEKLEESIYLEPPVDYTIEKIDENAFLLKPEESFPDNTVIRLAQIKNEKVTDSWAYQTKNDLTVSETYPRDGALAVSPESVLEIVLSYGDVENFDDYVSITPEISGSWAHIGKTWRFTPDQPLEKGTRYTVSIREGYHNDSVTNTVPSSFSFNVFDNDEENTAYEIDLYKPVHITRDEIYTFRPGEAVSIPFHPVKDRHAQISHISMEQLHSAKDFIAKLLDENAQVESTSLGDLSFTWQNLSLQGDAEDTVVFDDTLPEGYYIARIYDMADRERSIVFLQVNSISAYALETREEALIWAAKDGVLAEGLSVAYDEKTTETDESGIARFALCDGKEIRHATVGAENPLVIGFSSFEGEFLNGYIYTDRPLYHETDLIQIWGYVPPEMLREENAKFTLTLGDWRDVEEEIPVKLDEFGCFTATYQLSDHKEDTLSIYLRRDGEYVSWHGVDIKDYSGQYYSYEFLLDKNYIRNGETLEFDVKVTHLSGMPASGKRVYADDLTAVTDENGIAHFSMFVQETMNESFSGFQPFTRMGIQIRNGEGTEYNNHIDYADVYVFYSDIILKDEIEDSQYTISAYKLNLDSDISVLEPTGGGPYLDSDSVIALLGTPIDQAKITARMIERRYDWYARGYRYNEYTKESEPVYYQESDPVETVVREWALTGENGFATIDLNDVSMKQPEDFIRYVYEIQLFIEDSSGSQSGKRIIRNTGYKSAVSHDGIEKNPNPGFIKLDLPYWGNREYSVDTPYICYGYEFSVDNNDDAYARRYSSGETVSVALYDKYHEQVLDGLVLRALLQNDVVSAEVVDPDTLSFTYPENLVPNAYLAGAYFKDGVFHRIPAELLLYNAKENALDVTVAADKETYAPGEEVTLELDVCDARGDGVAAEISISVVNEAVLALRENDVGIFENIFKRIEYKKYFFSTYQDRTLSREQGGWGDGGADSFRSNFGDTVYFKAVTTDENGHAAVTFKLPDTVTSYRVTTQAVSHGVKVGADISSVCVQQDYFIQHTEPRNVKTTDDLVVGVCAIGGEGVSNFTFTIKEIGAEVTTSAADSHMAYANFGKLPLGTYTVQIRAENGEKQDGVEYTVEIISTALTVQTKTKMKAEDGETIYPVKNPVVIEFCNSDMTRYQGYLDYLMSEWNARLDTQIASREALLLQNQYRDEHNYVPYYDLDDYFVHEEFGNAYLLSPLPSAESNVVFTALAVYYTEIEGRGTGEWEYTAARGADPYETALLQAANRNAVLIDLQYLASRAETDREKLLVSLAYAFLGDYGNAAANYVQTEDADAMSLQAAAATFIDRKNAAALLDAQIAASPSDLYLRFAVLSYLKNNTELLGTEESVTVSGENLQETVTVNGLEVKRIVVNADDLSGITFTSSSENMDVTYYYDTSVDKLNGDTVQQSITASLSGDLHMNGQVFLEIDLSGIPKEAGYGYFTVALPNNLRMTSVRYTREYSVVSKLDHLVIYLGKDRPAKISIPLSVTCEGSYEFEPVVYQLDETYYISSSFTYQVQ